MSSIDVRTRKANRLASRPGGIIQAGRGVYLVQSENMARHYRVAAGKGGDQCDCPDFQYRKEVCKHLLAVKVWLERNSGRSRSSARPFFVPNPSRDLEKADAPGKPAPPAVSNSVPSPSPLASPTPISPNQDTRQGPEPDVTSKLPPEEPSAPLPQGASPAVTAGKSVSSETPSMKKDRVSKGVAIALGGGIVANPDGSFSVQSESEPGKIYEVRRVKEKWACSCPDFQYRRIEQCKHIVAVLQGLIQGYMEGKASTEDQRQVCPKCGLADQVIDNGHDRKGGKRLNYCKRCGKYFRKPSLVRWAHFDPGTIASVLDLYFTGLSFRQASQWMFRNLRIKVSHQTICKWVKKWVPIIEKFIDMLVPRLSGVWHIDEMEVKVKGGFTLGKAPGMYNFRWNSMDKATKYYIATQLTKTRKPRDSAAFMQKSGAAAKEDPQAIVTDKHGTYPGGIAIAYPAAHVRPAHIRVLGGAGQRRGNQPVERLNNTVRARSKTMRGLKSSQSLVPGGEVIHYNHVRPHMSLTGMTPGEKAGLGSIAPGPNKLLSLLDNAVGFQSWMDGAFPATRW